MSNRVTFGVLLLLLSVNVFSQFAEKQTLTDPYMVTVACDGEVNFEMAKKITKGIEECRNYPRSFLVLELNSFGGRLDAAYEISDKIIQAGDITTIAYVKSKAISAGAMIALSCKYLYMDKSSTLGDCAPLMMSMDGPQMLGEKFQAPLRARFRALAVQNDFPPRLAEAMVTQGPEIYQYVSSTGVHYLDSSEIASLLPDSQKSYIKKMRVVEKNELLTLTAQEAVSFGFCRKIVNSVSDIVLDLNLKKVTILPSVKSNRWSSLESYWKKMSVFEKIFWYIAIPFTVLLVLMVILTLIGIWEFDLHGHDLVSMDNMHQDGHNLTGLKFFTIRNIIIFFAILGWTGIACVHSGFGMFLTIGISLISGIALVVVVSFLLYGVLKLTHDGTVLIDSAKGKNGTVYFPIPEKRSGYGKITVTAQGTLQELRAMTDGPRIESGAIVYVRDIEDKEYAIVEKVEQFVN